MALVSRELNPNRSLALDLFRGLTIAGMILVNNAGGPHTYKSLEHTTWNGWTPTDLVFPSFAFIVGVALAYSLSTRRVRTEWNGLSLFDWITPILLVVQYVSKVLVQTDLLRHAPNPPMGGYDLFFAALLIGVIWLPQLERRACKYGGSPYPRIIHRGFLIFALGFAWNFNAMDPAGFRTLGVLQRLGIVYIFAGLIIVNTRRRGQIAIVAGLLALYWTLMKCVPVPGYGAGVLTMEGNLAGFIDRWILGRAHMYAPGPLPYWDPEGILGVIPAVATGLLGAIAGGWMREQEPAARKTSGLVIAGGILLLSGLLLNPWFPINKNLWSPTFVLFAGGIDFILLGACIWLVDLKRAMALLVPFIVLGSNSILIYLLSGTLMHYAANIPGGTANGTAISVKEAAYRYLFSSWLDPYNASLAMALAYVALWMVIAGILYRKRMFVKL